MTASKMILGINGSPRRSNTEILLEEALESARTRANTHTKTISLKETTIHHCIGCFRCLEQNENEYGCQIYRDSMDEILIELKNCHGLIVASPVYFGGITGQMKTFFDRTEPLLRYARGSWRLTLRNKVGAGIVVGGNRNGGQETALAAIHHFFLVHDMVVVGTGPDEQPGCYLGAAGFSGQDPAKGSRVKDAVRDDEVGMRAARIIGGRVAEMVWSMV